MYAAYVVCLYPASWLLYSNKGCCLLLGTRLVFTWSATPPPKGTGTSVPQFLGFLSIYVYTLCCRTTKCDVVTYTVKGLVLGVSHAPTSRGQDPCTPNFGVLSIYAYIL